MSNSIRIFRKTSTILALLLAWFSLGFTAQAQNSRPITKKGLLEALRLKGLSDQELIQHIQKRGVDFELTPEDQSQLKQAGAGPQLIEAVRANHRATETVPETKNPPAAPLLLKFHRVPHSPKPISSVS